MTRYPEIKQLSALMPDQPDAPDQATVTIRKGSAATDVPADQVQDYVNRGWAVEGGAQRAERAAPFVGKAASEAVERVFSRASGAVGKVSEKASGAAQKFLSAAKDLEPYVSSTATKTLAGVRFGAGKADASEGDLAALYRARSSELYGQTMRQPDGTTVMRPEARAAMAAKLDPIRQVNPLLADQLETIQARKTAYLAMTRTPISRPQHRRDRHDSLP